MEGLNARSCARALCLLLSLPACNTTGTATTATTGSTDPLATVAQTAVEQAPVATQANAAAAGSAAPATPVATAPVAANAAPNTQVPPAAPAVPGHVDYPDLRGTCTLNSGFDDDHACIAAPAPAEGIQIHIGPKNYNDPNEVAKFIMHPGEESSQCWTYRTPNTQDIFFQSYVLSGRAGTHHILGSMLDGDVPTDQGFTRCSDTREGADTKNLGPMPMATKAYMPRTQVAPENQHIALRLPKNVLAQADMHYYNFTDHDILREVWLNLYTAPPEQITDEMLRVRGMGGFGWSDTPIQPGTDQVYQYECPIKGNGRILELLGHYHAHGVRFGASIKRKAGGIEKVFEMYSYQDPAGFEYNSVTKNPGFSANAAGAFSGILEVHDGDVLAWECHIVNDSDTPLRYTNEVETGEMCNLWGHSFGMDQWDCLMK